MATEAFYEDWFERFEAKLAREDMVDETAPFINLNRPEDRKRLLLVDQDGIKQALPATGEITDDQKEMLYHAAEKGRLFVVPLGEVKPLQAGIEDGNELVRCDFGPTMGFQYMGPRLVMPKLQELNFFKRILNSLFGAFEEEKQGYRDTYNRQLTEVY